LGQSLSCAQSERKRDKQRNKTQQKEIRMDSQEGTSRRIL